MERARFVPVLATLALGLLFTASPLTADTRIENSFIGPFTAIGGGCNVEGSEVEHSVVMEQSRIVDIPRLEDSLIGREAVVTRTQQRPRALRLMVGDHCQIDVE